jgi:hypothetical protein
MRSVTPALAAAIVARTRRPVITLSAEDHVNHLQQSVATGANADAWFDACGATDGGIVRVRVLRGGTGFANNFQYQRITDPTQASQWTSWTTFSGGSGNMEQDSGVAVSNNGGTLRAFAQQGTGGNAIFVWTSTDHGLTWSGPATVLSPPAGGRCKGLSSAGNHDLFLLYDVSSNNQLGCSFFSGGSWSVLHVSTLPVIPYVGGHTGLASVWNGSGSYTVIYSDRKALRAVAVSSDGNTWSQLTDVAPAANTNIYRLAPRMSFFDGLYQLTCIEKDDGVVTGNVYQYPRLRQSADLVHWSSGVILHQFSSLYGAHQLKLMPPAQSRARYVAMTLGLVELGLDYQQSDTSQYADLTARVLDYQRSEELGRPARLTLTLDNTAGVLGSMIASYGNSYTPLGLNTTLVLREGYRTGSPPTTPETLGVAKYRVRQLVIERAAGRSQVRIEASDLSALLDRINRFQVSYSNQTLSWLVSEICVRAGLFSLSLPATSQMSTVIQSFVLHAGQRFRDALQTLCHVGWLEYFLDQDEVLRFRELAASDVPVWSYAPEVERLTLGSLEERANHVIVSGLPPAGVPNYLGALTTGEAYDDTHLRVTGVERVLTVTDPRLNTAAQCASRAAFLLQQQQREQGAHQVVIAANPALQLIDVLSLSDQPMPAGTGQSTSARIKRQTIRFSATSAEFTQVIDLEGV